MTPKDHMDILKDLAPGEEVIYVGSSAYLYYKVGIKVKDRATKMVVRVKNKEYRLEYSNLLSRSMVMADLIAKELTK